MTWHKTVTGQRYGRLLAIQDVGSHKNSRVWEFKCDCGALVKAKSSLVRFGKIRSCGCLARELTSLRKRHKLAGMTFGRLTVLECVGPSAHGHIQWLCSCICGGSTRLTGTQISKGITKSCGCLRNEVAAASCRSRKTANPISKTQEYRRLLRKRLRQNPTKAMAERMSRLLAHAIKGVGSLKKSPTFQMLGYAPEKLRYHIEGLFMDGMSWGNRCQWQIDHIRPISLARTIDDVISLNQLINLRPLWSELNNAKKDKLIAV